MNNDICQILVLKKYITLKKKIEPLQLFVGHLMTLNNLKSYITEHLKTEMHL